ncbi:hypothetical protein K2P97_02370 [bacterium]|nr:hypothetical protein [bacterium]
MKRGFGKMNDFMNRYIGDYVVCLMEYGELPSLGINDATMKKHLSSGDGGGRKCDQEFAGFTFGEGRPPTTSTGGTGGTGSNGGSSSANSGKGNNSSNANKDGSESANKGKNGGDAGSDLAGQINRDRSGSSGKKSAYAKGQIVRSNPYGSADSGGDVGNENVRVIEDSSGGKKKKDSGSVSRTSRLNYSGGERYRAITGTMAAEIEKRAPKRAPAERVISQPLAGDTGSRFGPYKKTFTPPEVKEIEQIKEDNSGFGFGYIIRWLLIGGMILALIVFFGGQVMNYSNSKD